MNTATIFSSGSTQNFVWYAPPQTNSPTDPGRPDAADVLDDLEAESEAGLALVEERAHGVRRHQLDGLRARAALTPSSSPPFSSICRNRA